MAPGQTTRNKTAGNGKKADVKKPFQVYQHKRRKYVRLEVNSPLKFKVLNPANPDFSMDDRQSSLGSVLNISGGGVLIETEYSVHEDDLLILEFTLVEADTLSGIIGKVKRADEEGGEHRLVGIEFMTPEQLKEELPSEIYERIGQEIFSFDEQLRKMLLKYVFSQKVEKA